MKNYKIIDTSFYNATPSEHSYEKFSPKSILQFAQEYMESWTDLDERNFYTEVTSTYEQTGENQIFVTVFSNGKKQRQYEIIDLNQETIFNCSLDEFKIRLETFAMELEKSSPKDLRLSLTHKAMSMVSLAKQELMTMDELYVTAYEDNSWFQVDVGNVPIFKVDFKRSSKNDPQRWRGAKLHFIKSIQITFYCKDGTMEDLFKLVLAKKEQFRLATEEFNDEQYAKFLDCVDKKDFFGAYKIYDNLSYSEKARFEKIFEVSTLCQ